MLSPGGPGVRSVLAMIGLLAAGCTTEPLATSADAAYEDRLGLEEFGLDVVIPSQNISLPAGKFLEIDDLSLTGTGARDTNLCSSSTNLDFDTSDGDACP